jgi:hypothetical protein
MTCVAPDVPSNLPPERSTVKKPSILAGVPTLSLIQMAMLPVAAVLAGSMAMVGSQAAFSGATDNLGNSWTAGTVALTNNKASALFTASGVVPGYTEAHCITVTSASTVPTTLSFYVAQGPNTNQLGDNLNLKIEAGSGGTDVGNDCTGFVPAQTLHNGTMTGLSGARGTALTAVDIAAPLAAAGAQQFKITATLPANTPNTVQSGTAGMDFKWINRTP